jgi:hypothetical protein
MACNWSGTQGFVHKISVNGQQAREFLLQEVQIGGVRVIFRSYPADGPSWITRIATRYASGAARITDWDTRYSFAQFPSWAPFLQTRSPSAQAATA